MSLNRIGPPGYAQGHLPPAAAAHAVPSAKSEAEAVWALWVREEYLTGIPQVRSSQELLQAEENPPIFHQPQSLIPVTCLCQTHWYSADFSKASQTIIYV